MKKTKTTIYKNIKNENKFIEVRADGYGHYKVNLKNYNEYFSNGPYPLIEKPFGLVHNGFYFKICYWNLIEKYIRHQKDFSYKEMAKICDLYEEVIGNE